MCARFAWNICVGSQVLQRWRLRYLASGGGGHDSWFFFILGMRGAVMYADAFPVVPVPVPVPAGPCLDAF